MAPPGGLGHDGGVTQLTVHQVAKRYGLYSKITGGQRIDLFDLETPDEIESISGNAWIRTGSQYRLSLSHGERLVVAPNILGEWEVLLASRGAETLLMRARQPAQAVRGADPAICQAMAERAGRELTWLDSAPRVNGDRGEAQLRLEADQGLAPMASPTSRARSLSPSFTAISP